LIFIDPRTQVPPDYLIILIFCLVVMIALFCNQTIFACSCVFSTASAQVYATGRAAGIAGIKSQIEKNKI
jgi:hypothetical protein